MATPTAYPYTLPVRVRFCETDANGHVSQVSYLIYFEEARTRFMEAEPIAFSWFRGDHQLVLARQWIEYLAPAYFPDALTVRSAPVRLGRSSLTMAHVITRDADDTVIARGESTMVLVAKATGHSTPWPERLRVSLAPTVRPDLAIPFERPSTLGPPISS
jgi:acyl-CoA thioester hydrolase